MSSMKAEAVAPSAELERLLRAAFEGERPSLSEREREGLLPHQVAELPRLIRLVLLHRGALVTQRLGSGKTYLALGLARFLKGRFGMETVVVAPARLLPMWRRAAAALRVELTALASHRAASDNALPTPDEPQRTLWLVDEAHQFRNPETARSEALASRLCVGYAVLLTATPVNLGRADLETLLRILGLLPCRGAESDEVWAARLDMAYACHSVSASPVAAFEVGSGGALSLMGTDFNAKTQGREGAEGYLVGAALEVGSGGASSVLGSDFNAKTQGREDAEGFLVGAALEVGLGELLNESSNSVSHPSAPRAVRRRVCVELDDTLRGDAFALLELLAGLSWPVFGERSSASAPIVGELLAFRLLSHPRALRCSLERLRRYYERCRSPRGHILSRAAFRDVFESEGPTQGRFDFAWPEGTTAGLEELRVIREGLATLARLDRQTDVLERWSQAVGATVRREVEARVGAPRRQWGTQFKDVAVIFTQYSDSAQALEEALSDWSVGVLTGACSRLNGLPIAPERLLESLDPQMGPACCQVLLCTDVLGAGHNLQQAHTLLHLDRTWNPVRMAQREGRLLRIGQTAAEVHLLSVVPAALHPMLDGLSRRVELAIAQRRSTARAVTAHCAALPPFSLCRLVELEAPAGCGELVRVEAWLASAGTQGGSPRANSVPSCARNSIGGGWWSLSEVHASELRRRLASSDLVFSQRRSPNFSTPRVALLQARLYSVLRRARRNPKIRLWLRRVERIGEVLSKNLSAGLENALDNLIRIAWPELPEAALWLVERELTHLIPRALVKERCLLVELEPVFKIERWDSTRCAQVIHNPVGNERMLICRSIRENSGDEVSSKYL
ncbi:MAG: hypothetical protein COW42_13590 [Deltaproteobacteria bacterium CG17_big_fil_post_rev_8_21_14_2_50_63_7]|nr:MAG: hypothetical protein COW42_13590 [Deltaproteobacteria bacterium CG17_big_fil_post_rev_8_21_14_2_50_63_7]